MMDIGPGIPVIEKLSDCMKGEAGAAMDGGNCVGSRTPACTRERDA